MSETLRKLTKQEVKGILSFVKPNPYIPRDIAVAMARSDIRVLKKQLDDCLTYPSLIPQIREELKKQYLQSKIQAGENVGVLTAQSIGQKQTQDNLNTFHKAGSSDKQPVTSKFSDLINATKEPKSPNCIVYFKHGNGTIPQLRATIGHTIVQLTFGKVIVDREIHLDKKPEPWYKAYEMFEGDDYKKYSDCLTCKIDMTLLYTYKLSLKDIALGINTEYSDMFCVYSPDCFGQIDVFVDMNEISLPEGQLQYISQEEAREIYLDDVVYPKLSDISVCGIRGVENMYFLRDLNDTWKIELENSRGKLVNSIERFKKILAHPAVDLARTISNNVWDIYHVFGIEASRQFMIEEFSNIMDGINKCHVMILVNKMTFNGTISSISRYTMRNEDSGPFGKASFEETLENFTKAAVYGQQEPTRGISASIICGKRSQIGTGMCELKVDMEKIM